MASESTHQKLSELQGNLMNFALMLTSDSNDARALVRDTMLRAQNAEERHADQSQLKDWLFSTMRSIFMANYNDRPATVVDPVESLYDLLATDSTEVPLEGVYPSNELALVISNFSSPYMMTYTLFVKGYHIEEIASRTHTTASRVKRIILKAQDRIRRRLSV